VTRGSADGVVDGARFRRPNGVAADLFGNVFVADQENHTIRKITQLGVVTTLAGLAPDFGFGDGTGSAAKFHAPGGVAVDSAGNVYVADALNYVIRKITPAGVVSTLAGSPGARGNQDGTGSGALFRFFSTASDTVGDTDAPGLTIDPSGNLYVTDSENNSVRKIDPAGVVTTVASGIQGIRGIAIDNQSNLYVTTFYTIRKITSAGVITVLAGLDGQTGAADGAGSTARFNFPRGLGIDLSGNLYVADTFNRTIRKVTPGGVVSTLAGLAGTPGTSDGTGPAARFSFVDGIAVDAAGFVYVTDPGGALGGGPDARTVRRIAPDGVVTTVVGRPGSAGNVLGALPASLGRVTGIAVGVNKQIVLTSDDGVFVATFP
jgi:sugar lactone lactonase YvrE